MELIPSKKLIPVFFLKKALLPFLFVSFLGGAYAEDPAQLIIGPFGTLNNRDNSAAISDNMAQDLLNVDISPGGKSFKKRKGYGQAFATTVTTSAIHGTFEFYDTSGNDITLAFNDTYLTSSVNGAAPTIVFSTGPVAATYQCVDSQGFAYCANTSRNGLIRTNGLTSVLQTIVTTGTMVAVTPDRLVLSGYLGAPNRIDFSAAIDFTSWATGSSKDSAFQFTITAPGSAIKHITYAFNRIMWFKDSSFGYILPGATAADWVIKTISPVVGTLDNSSVYWQDVLYFRGQDCHIYSYDGSNLQKISKEISGTILQTQRRTGNSWTQTSGADFGASSTTPSMYLDTTTVLGQITLSTAVAISSFNDNVSTDFAAGTNSVNIDTATIAGSVTISVSSDSLRDYFYPATDLNANNTCIGAAGGWSAQSFTTSAGYFVTSVTLRLLRQGTPTGNYAIAVYSDNSGSPGIQLASTSLLDSTVGTSTQDITVAISSPSLSVSTTYWIRIDPPASCDNTPGSIKRLLVLVEAPDGGNPIRGITKSSTGSSATTSNWKFKVNGRQFLASGSFVSRAFDTGFSTNVWLWSWGTLSTDSSIPTNTTLTYETQTSSSATGTFSSLASVLSGSAPTSTVQEFIRYKATFTTTNQSTGPVLNALTVAMTPRIRPFGTFYSQVKNAPNLTSWDSFTANALSNIGVSTQTFYIRASTTIFSIGSSTPAWVQVTNGAIPSASTGTFFQIRDDFVTSSYNLQLTLLDFTQSWFEGSATDKSYATYFNDAVLFSVAYGSAASSNNRILKYDLLNQGWLIYDLPSNGFYLKNLSLYFGGSSSGYVFKYGDTDNDNGSAINAYWKSKDFIGGDPFRSEEIRNISIYGEAVANSTVTVTMTTNEAAITTYTIPTYRNGSYFFNSNRNLPAGLSSNSFNIKVGNNAADQPFQIIAERVGLAPKPWMPTSQ